MPTTAQLNQHEIKRSILAVLEDNPIDTLQFISSSLQFIGTSLDHKPQLSDTDKAEEGAGYLITFLAHAIDDVEKALNKKYRPVEADLKA